MPDVKSALSRYVLKGTSKCLIDPRLSVDNGHCDRKSRNDNSKVQVEPGGHRWALSVCREKTTVIHCGFVYHLRQCRVSPWIFVNLD